MVLLLQPLSGLDHLPTYLERTAKCVRHCVCRTNKEPLPPISSHVFPNSHFRGIRNVVRILPSSLAENTRAYASATMPATNSFREIPGIVIVDATRSGGKLESRSLLASSSL